VSNTSNKFTLFYLSKTSKNEEIFFIAPYLTSSPNVSLKIINYSLLDKINIFNLRKISVRRLLESFKIYSKISNKSFSAFYCPIILATSCKPQAMGFLIFY